MADKYGRTMYQIMLENGATEDELRQQLSGTGTPQSYLDREAQKAAAAAAAQPTYSLPSQWFDGMSRIGEAQGWKIDNSDSATWQKIAQLANSGNTQGAIDLANQLSAAGKFGGYYDDQGNYWGFAQGYTGGANASMQPVIGGQMLTPKGLEYENTGIWLTPDGKALNYGQGGVLTNNGETWGTTDNRNAQAVGRWYDENGTDSKDARWNTWDAVGARMGWTPEETFANMSKSGAFLNPELNSQGTIYQQALNQTGGNNYPTGGSYNDLNINPQSPNYSEMILTAAPEAYDPNSSQAMKQWQETYGIGSTPQWNGGTYNAADNQMYQDYLKWFEENKAPEYAGDPYQAKRDAALEAYGEKWGGSEYQPLRDQYLQNAANMKWDYNPDTDPVWQAYQKQYRREGQRAMEDTLGRVAGMTGGMPSSYAVTAASQAGNHYASQLSDKLPQLYQDAYNRYLQEYQRQLGLSDAYAQFDNTEYARWLNGQQQNLDLANAYNQYGLQDYEKYRDSVSDYYNDAKTRYQLAMDNIDLERGDWERGYGLFQDQLGQYNKDRDYYYGVGQDEIANGRQAAEDQYKRYLDAVEQQNYINERMQYLKEYADQQNWKATEWQQYLREYGDQLSQQEREWVYKQMQAANDQALDLAKLGAQYGDYSGLSGMGIDTSTANPKEVAYASDGSTYKFNTQDALYFVQNAPNGTAGNPTTMKGSDGSIWRKDEYGGITITTKNGKTFTYSNPVVPETKNTGTYRYVKDTGNTDDDSDIYEDLRAAGIDSEARAYQWLTKKGYNSTQATKYAKYFMEMLETETLAEEEAGDAQDVTPPTVNTRQKAKDWLMSVGIPADIAGRVPDEYEWQREHNTPGSDAYGFTNYVDFLNAYMRYLYANYGG